MPLPKDGLTTAERQLVVSLLKAYASHHKSITVFHDQLMVALKGSAALANLIHSMRSRLKDPDHLAEKLERKIFECKLKRKAFTVKPDNLLTKINDLVGFRLLHLYTRQFTAIDAALREVLDEGKYQLIEGPFARTWDDESRQFFQDCKVQTQDSPSMYTSVHYVIGSASKTTVTAEIQVRTLSEEVWGEVDHTMNYPRPIDNVACREQLKVLARVTSSASRLVDSIFATVEDHKRGRSQGDMPTKARKKN
jgi:ppGpp synthetase/RelA/SpoT-type nucleotidyltranferase